MDFDVHRVVAKRPRQHLEQRASIRTIRIPGCFDYHVPIMLPGSSPMRVFGRSDSRSALRHPVKMFVGTA
jgi:hypothetical protein